MDPYSSPSTTRSDRIVSVFFYIPSFSPRKEHCKTLSVQQNLNLLFKGARNHKALLQEDTAADLAQTSPRNPGLGKT